MPWSIYAADGSLKTLTDASTGLTGTVPVANGGLAHDYSASTGIPKLAAGAVSLLDLDLDGTLAANSDTKIPSQKAIRTYTAAQLAALQALVFQLAQNNAVSGTGDFTNGKLIIPNDATAILDEWIGWDTTRKVMTIGDSQRARAANVMGWTPWIFPSAPVLTGVAGANITLAANGGTVQFPIEVLAHALVDSVLIGTGDATLARSYKWGIFDMPLNNGNSGENALPVRITGSESYTAAATGLRTTNPTTLPFYLEPGVYMFVIQNTHASNTLALQTWAQAVYTGQTMCKTKTTSNPFGSTLDVVEATWTNQTVLPVLRIKCRVAGLTTAW